MKTFPKFGVPTIFGLHLVLYQILVLYPSVWELGADHDFLWCQSWQKLGRAIPPPMHWQEREKGLLLGGGTTMAYTKSNFFLIGYSKVLYSLRFSFQLICTGLGPTNLVGTTIIPERSISWNIYLIYYPFTPLKSLQIYLQNGISFDYILTKQKIFLNISKYVFH
jgi:hypothetical protein